ncbi:MAG: hypothetical protein PSY14_15955 [bacterium]|nr:hypothetical protein [bacterium]
MTIKKALKQVMKEVKHGVKHHRDLQKKILDAKESRSAEGRALLGASRRHLMTLFAREEVLESRLIDGAKTIKILPKKGNGVAHPRSDRRAAA